MVALLLRFLFFPFQAVECLLRRTSASDVEKEATGVLVAEDSTKDLDPLASGLKEQSTHHSGINPVNQSSHDTAGVFEDIIKVDDMFSPTHELESVTSDPGSPPLSVKGRLKAHVQFWERIILDLGYVNQHIFKQRVKFEDWRVGLDYFEKGSYFTKFDLKSGYHHLDIFPDHQHFLGFSWVMSDGTPSLFMFTVLPFGLSAVPYIFTKLLRPLVKQWRSQGIHTVVYLDDGFDVVYQVVW